MAKTEKAKPQAKAKAKAEPEAKKTASKAPAKAPKAAPKTARMSARKAGEARAVVRMLRTSPYKLNDVAALIRGMRVSEALNQLTFNRRRIAGDVKKALQSAIANAENNHNLNVDDLVVKEAFVGKNMVMKRTHTRGRGRMARILKPFSQLTIVVREQAEKKETA